MESIAFYCTIVLKGSIYIANCEQYYVCCIIQLTLHYNYTIHSAYRISTGRHTIAQTLVGAIVGLLTGTCAVLFETHYLRVFVPEDLFPISPHWLRYFIIVTGVFVLFRKKMFTPVFTVKDEHVD